MTPSAPYVERAGDEMVFTSRHPDHRHDRQPAAERELHLQCLEIEPRVLHVVEHEVRAGVAAELRDAGRKELEDQRTDRTAARRERRLDRVVTHARACRGRPGCASRSSRGRLVRLATRTGCRRGCPRAAGVTRITTSSRKPNHGVGGRRFDAAGRGIGGGDLPSHALGGGERARERVRRRLGRSSGFKSG
jgi:hypothetical protein